MIDVEKPSTATLIILRTFDVPSEVLFDAWINPEIMKKWFFTTEATNILARNEPKVGGTFEIVDFYEEADYQILGYYKEINPPSKLVFTFKMPHINEAEDLIEVQIKPFESGCKMTFIQEIRIPTEAGLTEEEIEAKLKEYHDQTEQGWGYIFDELKKIMETEKENRFYEKMLEQGDLNGEYFNDNTNHETNI